jgi:hypothetical protein
MVSNSRLPWWFHTAGIALILTSCAQLGNQPTSWIASSSNETVFVQWTLTGENLIGSLQAADPNTDISGDPITTQKVNITGVISKGNITINEEGALTLTGKIDNSHLILNVTNGSNIVPITFVPGSPTDYNNAVTSLTNIVNQSRSKVAQRKIDESFTTAIANLPSAEGAVTSTILKVNQSISALEASYQALKRYSDSVLAGSCSSYDQSSQAFELNSAIFSADVTLGSDINSLDSARSDLRNVNLNFATESTVFSKELVTKAALSAIAKGQVVEDQATKLIAIATAYSSHISDSADSAMANMNAMNTC